MRNASEEERIKNELKEQEWLRQAILKIGRAHV